MVLALSKGPEHPKKLVFLFIFLFKKKNHDFGGKSHLFMFSATPNSTSPNTLLDLLRRAFSCSPPTPLKRFLGELFTTPCLF